MRIYGVINSENIHTDVSNTERGAKQFATRNGFKTVSYRSGYNAVCIADKVNGKWVKSN